ncbi:tetraspanin-6-like isoform X2 [Mercenaria mercenaria]|uniref:tetraspanin-6-like isoform X1 n=1 Tax=Mercenaria mercenaria TaxID=6596 RepID=UPI00234E94DB|nr:tetraspanin-6-like isoform X1 [Mercenaria mercenaria]XP_053385004.1 tetraspanin-6-like isoform X2 [Mercenaria mercenaria]
MGKRSGSGKGCGCGIGCGCGCCGGVKFCLILFNTIFLISSAALVAFGIWAKVEKNFVSLQNLVDYGTGDRTLRNTGSVLIGFGFFFVIVSAFGCLAVCRAQKKYLIILYTLLLFVILCCGIAVAVAYGVFKGKIDSDLADALNKTVNEYEQGTDLATDWDYMQTWMKCCGSAGPKDYTNVKFHDKEMHVPNTCCVLTNSDPKHPNPENEKRCQQDAYMYQLGNITSSQTLHTIGCYESLGDFIASKLGIIIGVGVAISTLQILGICLAIGLCINDDYRRF